MAWSDEPISGLEIVVAPCMGAISPVVARLSDCSEAVTGIVRVEIRRRQMQPERIGDGLARADRCRPPLAGPATVQQHHLLG